MASVYISFSQRDVAIVRQIATALTELGHQVFYGEALATPGEDWNQALTRRLLEADLALVIVSKAAVDSGYVMAEAGAAIAYSRSRDGMLLVVPVAIDATPIPGALHGIAAILAENGDVTHIVKEVQRALAAHVGQALARREERRALQKRVADTAGDYIKESLQRLRTREVLDRRIAHIWYTAAFTSIVTAVALTIWRIFELRKLPVLTWPMFAEFFCLGFVGVALLVAMSKFAFTLGKSFMVEAIRNADRIHAISFGEFYLRAFGERANWAELKEAFQHWNVDRGSAFAVQDSSQYDPRLAELATELTRVVASLRSDEAKR